MSRKYVGWASPTAAFVARRRCAPYRAVCCGQCPRYRNRRGVILLVVMVLLALMTMLGLTLVLVTAQGRLSALAGSRDLESEHDSQELTYARMQVISGSTDPNSSFGAHGLLEDIYGLPQFFGQIMPNTGAPSVLPIGETTNGATYLAGGNNGTLLQLLVTTANVNPATGAAIGLPGVGGQSAAQYVLPQNSGAFCGQVITMLTGNAAGQSARVVGYYFLAGSTFATMQVSSFGGVVPGPSDQFMINGRPFSGTGFGLDLTKFYGGSPGVWGANVSGVVTATTGAFAGGNTPLLSALEIPATAANPQPPSSLPYAYLPNHARLALSTFVTGMPGYWDPAGPGGANEPYDAPDFQNLMLAMHYYSPFLLPTNSPIGVITPIPSLHRPEVVAWFYNQSIINPGAFASGGGPPAMGNPFYRRKVILRPEPTDNYFDDMGPPNGNVAGPNGIWDAREPWHDVNGNGVPDDFYLDGPDGTPGTPAFLDLNGDGAWTAGETDYSGNTFNPVTGCWYIAANGGWALDTKAGLDVDNDQDLIPDSIWVDGGLPVHTEPDGTFTKNLVSVLCIDLDGKVNLNAHGTLAQLDQLRYDNYPLSTGSVSGPLAGSAGTTTLYKDNLFQRNAPVGQGYGPADVNPLHLFVRSHAPADRNSTNTVIAPPVPTYTYSAGSTSVGTLTGYANLASVWPLRYYTTFLQGYDYQSWLQGYDGFPNSGVTIPAMQVDGRYGESSRLTVPPGALSGFAFPGVFPQGSYNAISGYLNYTQQLLNGPRAGWSQWFDPYNTSLLGGGGYWVNDPVALARFSDIRPGLLTPPNLSTTPFFFDFLDSYLPGIAISGTHLPTAHGSPPDLHSRGMVTTDVAGRPYYAGTLTFPWQVTGLYQVLTSPGVGWQPPPPPPATNTGFYNYWLNTMTDFAANEYGVAAENVLNEGVDTQYEMDLRQNARQGGENTGNAISGIPDYASVDGKLSPSELEGILRAYEQGVGGAADSSSLLQRLNNLETASALSSTPLYSLLANKNTASATPPTAISPRNDIRLAVTTESWDLPMPNLAPTPRQMQDLVQYVDYYAPLGAANALVNPTGTLNLNNIGLVDLARARIFADNFNPVALSINPNFPLLSATSGVSAPDISLFGDMKNMQPNVGTFPVAPVWPLLAPETVLGMRLDVNRLLGNGQDDNLNGVVDEPLEVIGVYGNGLGEAMVYPFSQVNTAVPGPAGQVNPITLANGVSVTQNSMLGILDLNNDGFYPITLGGSTSADPQTGTLLPADPTLADMRARQLLAKHLYCLAMLLLDDRPYPGALGLYGDAEGTTQSIQAQIFNYLGPAVGTYALQTLPTGTPNYPMLATNTVSPAVHSTREQAAYVIAQWAVNVVDFRDRDSIMTPFEFDLYPFRADPYVPLNPSLAWVTAAELNLTWNVDDIIDPLNPANALTWSHQDDTQAYRGLVWGCERPELLMTETVAFHDRGTKSTTNAQTINDSGVTPSSGPDTVSPDINPAVATSGMAYDRDWDQVRRPRGSLVVELFNPTSYWDAPQADMQQPWQALDANGNRGMGVNLAQVAAFQPANNATGPTVSPVWRLVVAYSPWQGSESMCYNNAPAGAVLPVGGGGYTNSPVKASGTTYVDPRVPVLPPGAIHRTVYFTPFNPAFVTGGAIIPTSTVADTLLNNSFFADPGIVSAALPNVLLPPGQYALIGPANQDPAATGPYPYNIYAGLNSMPTGNAYPWKLQLAAAATSTPVGPQPSVAYLYGAAGAPQGPYAAGYTGLTSTSTSVKPAIGVPIQTNWYSSTGAGATAAAVYQPHTAVGTPAATPISTTLRMSVSEPEHGYPVWYGGAVTTATASGSVPPSLQDDATYSAAGFGNFPQHPFDSSQGNSAGGNYLQFNDLPNPYVAPGGSVGTTLGYTVLYLQRLANPLQAWDQKMNPYITVDSMPVDLTSYTGESGGTAEPATYYAASGANVINQENPQPTGYSSWTASPGANSSFDTRRRGYATSTTTMITGQMMPNIWTPLPTGGANVFGSGSYGANGKGTLAAPLTVSTTSSTGSSLGWINYEYSGGAYYSTGGANNPTSAMGTSGMPPYMYNGDPTTSIPWLAWNNRPYISQYELMLVPASSPSSQAQDFGTLGWAVAGASGFNEYQPYSPLPTDITIPPGIPRGSNLTPVASMLPAAQFMNLLNFFNNEQTLNPPPALGGIDATGMNSTNLLPNLYRVFEFLQVPSRYTGTQDMLNPSQFAGDNAAAVAASATGAMQSASHYFHTPFNWLARYREPGRINLNTIFDPIVFQSLMDDYPGTLFGSLVTDANGLITGDLNPVTGLADTMVWPRGLWASLARSRQGFYEDSRRNYLWMSPWGPQLMPGPYTLNYPSPPDFPLPYAVPNPSAPPNPVSQFAYNPSAAAPGPGINADIPTYFANPFRPDGSAAFVPPADTTTTPPVPLNYDRLMHQWTYPSLTPLILGTASNNGVNATLLRSQEGAAAQPTIPIPPTTPATALPTTPITTSMGPPWLPTTAVSSSEQMTMLESTGFSSFPTIVTSPTVTAAPPVGPGPLAQFDDTAFDLNNPSATYLTGSTTAYRNAGKNATFQYQMFTRLGNTTTNRSNVYAIWITLGKFQVQPVGVSPTNPDGYKLVKPYLDATGNQVVTRGFYIFDRSVPMGFQRGQDLNIEKGMLVERVLQLPSQ